MTTVLYVTIIFITYNVVIGYKTRKIAKEKSWKLIYQKNSNNHKILFNC